MKNKVIAALLSVAISFALWAYVVTVVDPESEETFYNVPVVLDGQSALADRELMIVSNTDYKVDLTLSGYRTDLNKLNASNITLMADLSQITTPGTHKLNYTVSYPGGGAIHVLEQDPQYIELTVVEFFSKEVPVRVEFIGTISDDYIRDPSATLDHSTVTVSGPKDVVDRITQARLNITLDGRTQTIHEAFPVVLCDDQNRVVESSFLNSSAASVRAILLIQRKMDVPITWTVVAGGGLTADMVTVTPDWESIQVAGSESVLHNLRFYYGTIDLAKIFVDSESIADNEVVLVYELPEREGVTNITGVTEVKLTVKIDPEYIRNMEVRKYKVHNLQAVNVPEGAEVHLNTAQLIVSIRGPREQLDQLKPENIQVLVDLAGAQEGNGLYVPTVRIEGVENVGAVNLEETKVAVNVTYGEEG